MGSSKNPGAAPPASEKTRNLAADPGPHDGSGCNAAGGAEYSIPAESVSDLVCIVQNKRVTYINGTGVRVLGASSADEIKGRIFEDLLAPEYRSLFAEGLDIFTMEHEALPIKMLRLNGESVEVELKVSYLRTAADGRLVVMARDVTETKRAAIALLERERRINAIMNNVVDGIVAIKETGRIESVNDSALGMFGCAEEELIGHNVKMLMTGDDAERHDGYLKGSWKTGAGGVIESRIRNLTGRRKDGATFPMELSVREMKYGVDNGFIGVVRDVTERQASEEALRNSETRLKEIVENAPMKIALYDANGNFILVNQAFAAFHGGTPDDFHGRTVNDIGEDLLAKHKTVLESGKEQEEERTVTAGDETRREHVIRFPVPAARRSASAR